MSPQPKAPHKTRSRIDEITYAFWAVVVAGLAILSVMDACHPVEEKGPAIIVARPDLDPAR